MTKKLPSVLLVEDNLDVITITSYFIKDSKLSNNIAIATNGEEALHYLKNNPPPDFILLDINMPRLNGWEFLEEYDKLDSNMKQSTKIVMVTASSNPEDKERAKRRNLDFFNKPLTPELLEIILKSV